jgi:hypothetical protein
MMTRGRQVKVIDLHHFVEI